MNSAILWLFLIWPQVGPQFVAPGMTYAQVAALVPERPVILNRTSNRVRGLEFTRARLSVTFDETGRVVEVQRR